MKHCRHFNGILQGSCAAGVYFDTVPRMDKPGINLPCLNDGGEKFCALRSPYTAEEIAADAAEMLEFSLRATKCRDAIAAHYLATKESRGAIECPACGGSLKFSIATCNGHIRARCETADCCAFIE